MNSARYNQLVCRGNIYTTNIYTWHVSKSHIIEWRNSRRAWKQFDWFVVSIDFFCGTFTAEIKNNSVAGLLLWPQVVVMLRNIMTAEYNGWSGRARFVWVTKTAWPLVIEGKKVDNKTTNPYLMNSTDVAHTFLLKDFGKPISTTLRLNWKESKQNLIYRQQGNRTNRSGSEGPRRVRQVHVCSRTKSTSIK